MLDKKIGPYGGNPFIARLEKAINDSDKSQADIASACGYNSANIITQIKRGLIRVTSNRVIPMAEYLGLDPVQMYWLWCEAYEPAMLETVHKLFNLDGKVTENELGWIHELRDRFKGKVPAVSSRAGRAVTKELDALKDAA